MFQSQIGQSPSTMDEEPASPMDKALEQLEAEEEHPVPETPSEEFRTVETFPPTIYSMIGKGKGIALAFGIFVFAIQHTLLWLLRESFLQSRGGEDITSLVLAVQAFAGIGFLLFSEHALGEVYDAWRMWPNPCNADQWTGNEMMFLASLLRSGQGTRAVMTAIELITNRDNPYQIILMITAVETISRFDEIAFRMARAGRYGKHLQAAAKEVESKKVPDFVRDEKHLRFNNALFHGYEVVIFLSFVSWISVNAYFRNLPAVDGPPIRALRVQFPRSSGLEEYGGCYVLPSREATAYHHVTNSSNGTTEADTLVRLGNCEEDHRWSFYITNTTTVDGRNVGDDETATTAPTQPLDESCNAGLQIVQSLQTNPGSGVPLDSADIPFVSETPWVTPPDHPFFETIFLRIEPSEFCDSLVPAEEESEL